MNDRSLRILLVGDYPPDLRLGSPKVLYKLRDEFIRAGHDADVLLRDDLGAAPRSRHLRDIGAPWLAWKALRRRLDVGHRYDVIDASGAEALVVAARRDRIEALRHTAVIARSHGLEHLNYARMLLDARERFAARPWYRRVWYPATRMRLVERAARRADRLIVLNEIDRAFAIERRWKNPEHVVIVAHGVSDAFFAPQPAASTRAGLLFCGSWNAMKGIHYLADAFGRLCERRSDVRLTVLGPGVPAESVLSEFPEQARSSVRVVPRCNEQGVVEEFQQHAALVMCSTYEGFGMVVPEAMASGLPVIATKVGVAASLVEDGGTGVLVPLRDAQGLSLAMERVLDDGPLRARLAIAARQAVGPMTWAESARRTVEVYRGALASRVGGSAAPVYS